MIVIVLNKFFTNSSCDTAEPWQLGFQDAATPMMQGIIDLHHDIFFFLILILVFVSRILVRALWHFNYKKNPIPQRIVHGTTIEILRTIFPSIIPMFIAIPSFALLYSMDEVVVDPAITIKAIGHQWYRTYEYSDYNSSDEQSLTFDSYTIPEEDLELGQYVDEFWLVQPLYSAFSSSPSFDAVSSGSRSRLLSPLSPPGGWRRGPGFNKSKDHSTIQ
ncbi:hypothetical protein QN277_011918 [Acacia crassicarpa]|uniref:Cytochrome c oxidase subunit 2 n=1 Tax=Acacia crassicarpa TaxID=499986 RepID=A0AAE1N0E7_9FABA|nr:hypothetical protein QN277_011918 [Acacia crassicarpa]